MFCIMIASTNYVKMDDIVAQRDNSQGENDEKIPVKSSKKSQYNAKDRIKSCVHLWNKEAVEDLLHGVYLAALEKNSHPDVENFDKQHPAVSTSDDVPTDIRLCERMFCVTCAVSFEERDDQMEHFKSDWHRFNLKRRLRNQENVSELRFEELTKSGDLSSISGSDSSTDEEDSSSSRPPPEDEEEHDYHVEGIGKRLPRVFMRNTSGELFSVYRCVVYGKKNQVASSEALVSMVTELPREMTWAVFMLAGGHFAAAIFDGNTVVEHKTYHRYVVRAKRGTVQSSRDGKGHAPKSGGASLRRYNEAALAQEIQDLLGSWSQHMKRCSRIFMRAPTYSKSTFYGGKTPVLCKTDNRIRVIPFPTRRPTFKELNRVHELLATIECYGAESMIEDHIPVSPKKLQAASGKPDPAVTVTVADDSAGQIGMHVLKQDIVKTDSDSDENSVELMAEYLTIDTEHLQPFQNTRVPKKKKNREKHKVTDDVKTVEKFTDSESRRLRNELYTACKTKNTEQLRTLLHNFKDAKVDSVRTETAQDTADINMETSSFTNITNAECELGSTSDNVEEGSGSSYLLIDDGNNTTEMLNYPFGDHGLTLLHVAASECHKEAISLLMEAGADPCIKDGQGQLPYISAANKDARNEFRRFMAKYPDTYDYQKAQIPGPLSEDVEKDKKAKIAERKRMLKKSKKERLKDQKAEEAEQREEDQEKRRFLSLSDREKRALAAERRLTSQVVSSGQAAPILLRCYQCATDITAKVPFEYGDYKFCMTKCLKQHRLANSAKKS